MLGEARVRWGDALPGGAWGAGMLVGTGRSPCSPALFCTRFLMGLGEKIRGTCFSFLLQFISILLPGEKGMTFVWQVSPWATLKKTHTIISEKFWMY